MSIVLWYLVRGVYQHPVVRVGGTFLSQMEGAPPPETYLVWEDPESPRLGGASGSVREPRPTWILDTGIERDGRLVFYEIPIHEATWNLIIFIGLLLLVPRRRLLRRWWWALVSCGLIFLSHAGLLALNVLAYLARDYYYEGYEILERDTINVIARGVKLYGLVGAPLLPLLLLLPLFLKGKERGIATESAVEEKVRPNSPCPCGSGRKYKRCCGS